MVDRRIRPDHPGIAARMAVDEPLRECQFSAAVVWTVLLELELAGRVERQPGNRVSLT